SAKPPHPPTTPLFPYTTLFRSKNTVEKNHADPRLAPAQAIVDDAMQKARERGESARMVNTVVESTRQLVADRIKTGAALEGASRSEEHTSELQSRFDLVCRLLL